MLRTLPNEAVSAVAQFAEGVMGGVASAIAGAAQLDGAALNGTEVWPFALEGNPAVLEPLYSLDMCDLEMLGGSRRSPCQGVSPPTKKAGVHAVLGLEVCHSGHKVFRQNGSYSEAQTSLHAGAQVGSGIGSLCRLMAGVGGSVLTAVLVAQAGCRSHPLQLIDHQSPYLTADIASAAMSS